jgi:alpha-D-ribose 1-methylphosphonate 5-triphosphate synthase subunit PhnI
MQSVGPGWLLDLPPLKDVSPRLRPAPALPQQRRAVVGALLEEWITTAARGLEEVASRSDPTRIALNQQLLSLCYYCDAQALLEVRRKLRNGAKDAALGVAIALLEDTRRFLEFLRSKTGV